MLLTSVGANATDLNQYATLRLNYNFMKPELKDEDGELWKSKDQIFGGAIAYGVKFTDFRVEIEGFYNSKAKDKLNAYDLYTGDKISIPVDLKTKGLFLNGYWDIPVKENFPIRPYLNAGIGYAWKKLNYKVLDEKGTEKDDGFAWNAGVGVSYELQQNWNLDLGYRYENLGDLKDDGDKIKIENHKITLGLRYTF